MRPWIIYGVFFATMGAATACSTTTVNPGGTNNGGASSSGGPSVGSTSTSGTTSGPSTTTTTTGTTSGPSTTSGPGPSTVTTGSQSGPSTTSGAGAGGAGGACASPISTEDCDESCPNGQLCGECCIGIEMAGLKTYNTELWASCGCAQGSPCLAECSGDVCQNLDGAPDAACGNCISNLPGNTPCIESWTTECQSDQDCALFMACLYACPSP